MVYKYDKYDKSIIKGGNIPYTKWYDLRKKMFKHLKQNYDTTSDIQHILPKNKGGAIDNQPLLFVKSKNYIKIYDKTHYENIKWHVAMCGGDVSKWPTKTPKKIPYKIKNKTHPIAKMFTSKNTIEFFRWQNLPRFKKLWEKNMNVRSFIKWYNKTSQQAIAFSGFISFILGIRDINDIDIYYVENPAENLDSYLDVNNGNLAHSMLSSTYKTPSLDFKDDSNFMYFMGVKCVKLDSFLFGRFLRQRPKSMAELKLISEYTKIPNVPVNIPNHKMNIKTDKGWSYVTDNSVIIRGPILYGDDWRNNPFTKQWEKTKIPVDKVRFQKIIDIYIKKMRSI